MNQPKPSRPENQSRIWPQDLVRSYPVLGALSPRFAQEVLSALRPVSASAATVVFEEDSPCTGLTFVTEGSLRVVRTSPQGREILLYRVRPGESCILTVSCLLGGTSYGARGIVETDLAGSAIPAGLFGTMVAEDPAFRGFIFELFGARVSALMQLVEEVAFHRLDSRISGLLIRRSRELQSAAIDVTHQELADQVGSVRETVSRVLDSLESQGGILLSRGRITVRDQAVLEEIAGFLAPNQSGPPERPS